MTTYEMARKVIARLKKAGFTVLRYNAITSNSIYLKVDYGVAGTIRISDHKGKGRYKYKYNILSSLPHAHFKHKRASRYYYQTFSGFGRYSDVVREIIGRRDYFVKTYGKIVYNKSMGKNFVIKNGSMGFWSHYTIE